MTNRHSSTPPEAAYPQHLWPDYAQARGDAAVAVQRGGEGVQLGTGVFGVVALVVGLVALAAPLLPMDMTGFRQYVAFPFAVPGIALAALGLAANRRARAAAAAGLILSTLALGIGAFMTVTFR